MARSQRQLGLAQVLLLLFACTTPMGTATAYDPSRIVPDLKNCPVANVQWPPEAFQQTQLVSVFAPLIGLIGREDCKQQAGSLAGCAFDGSLGVQSGCCTSECATNMNKVREAGCFPVITNVLCNATAEQATQVQGLLPVLLGAAERCANYQPPPAIDCGNGKMIPTGVLSGALGGAGAPAAEAPMPEVGLPGAAGGPAQARRRHLQPPE